MFWVKAEISSGREHGGSFYCTLIETNSTGKKILAKMNCTIWSRDLSKIKQSFQSQGIELQLTNGTLVGFLCSVQYSPQFGLSLKAESADPAFALGELELKKLQIIERLNKEGLFAINKRLLVPMLPQRIGLITSEGSAAYNDFVETLQESRFGFKVFLGNSAMQGNNTETTVLMALDVLEKINLDLVVIVRGGGSKTDLYALDNELIARRIAGYRLPVWTGIGHEIDTSVLDLVANKRLKTPTAVAEELVARFVEMSRHLEDATNRFKSTWQYNVQREERWLTLSKAGIKENVRKLIEITRSQLRNSANLLLTKTNYCLSTEKTNLSVAKNRLQSSPLTILNQANKDVGYYKSRLNKENLLAQIKHERDSLKSKQAILKAHDPKTSLKRGFSLIYDKAGKLIKSVSEIASHDTITTELSDGRITSTIETIKENQNNE
jgi:exodeoxyribonuclease VII large subunit